MRKKSFLGLAAFLMFACTAMIARADAPHVRMIANDPAFDSLVNPTVLQEASEGNDAGVMVDAAIMLERAEETLHRPHRGGTAEDMYRHAWKTATAFNDNNAKERIRQHLRYYKKDSFLRELEGIQYSAPIMPKRPLYSGGSERELFEDFMNQAEDALRRLDYARAKDLMNQVNSRECPLTEEDKTTVYVHLEKITTQIYQATHNEDGSLKRDSQPWGWGHGPSSDPPPAPPQPEPNSWGHNGPHFGPPVAPPPPEQAPYRSKALKALFKHAPHGAKITAIFPGSPLANRLQVGDIITALDGVPVNSTWELENHFSATRVDYMDNRGLHQRTFIRIRNR
ncbi:MAG: PDZ domain-containing protein [Planctomycetia bacterium]|nr:PDZ domain-containing protein [Planctomycetia bacterium]